MTKEQIRNLEETEKELNIIGNVEESFQNSIFMFSFYASCILTYFVWKYHALELVKLLIVWLASLSITTVLLWIIYVNWIHSIIIQKKKQTQTSR